MAQRMRRTRRVVRRVHPPTPAGTPILIAMVALALLVLFSCCCGLRSCARNRKAKPEKESSRTVKTVMLGVESEGLASRLASLAPEPDVLIPTAEQAARTPALRAARVVVYTPETGKPARGGGVFLRADQEAGLALLLQCSMPGDTSKNLYYSDAPTAKWGDTVIPADRLSPWPEECGPLNIRWYKIEPEKEKYDNGSGDRFAFAEIKYVRNRVAEWDNKWYVKVDVDPIQYPARLPGLGTMRYQVEVFQGQAGGAKAQVIASAGLEQNTRRGMGPGVPRVSIRKDDSYPGWLFAWANVPYVFGSETPTGKARDHQAELFQGSDCCDTLVAAARAFGLENLHYTSTFGLSDQAKTVCSQAKPDANGVYLDASGKPLAWGPEGVQPGDMLVMAPDSSHVVALLADEGTKGVLDGDDQVFHHLLSTPRVDTVKGAYDATVIRVYRWKIGG